MLSLEMPCGVGFLLWSGLVLFMLVRNGVSWLDEIGVAVVFGASICCVLPFLIREDLFGVCRVGCCEHGLYG